MKEIAQLVGSLKCDQQMPRRTLFREEKKNVKPVFSQKCTLSVKSLYDPIIVGCDPGLPPGAIALFSEK